MHLYERESEWLNVLGQSESARLEFKSSRLFENDQKAIDELSKEISAFANTEGGTILVGIDERREGKSRVADRIVGLPAEAFSPEWLQQKIESNLTPYLPGIRVHRVVMKSHGDPTVGFAISVPAGSTAYQANDRKYYGRSEYESKALPDNEIRLRMMKGRIASALVVVDHIRYDKATSRKGRARTQGDANQGGILYGNQPGADETHDAVAFHLGVMNTSDTSIREFVLDVGIASTFWESNIKLQKHFPEKREIHVAPSGRQVEWPQPVLFPGAKTRFPEMPFVLRIPIGADFHGQAAIVHWTLFLDNSPPCRGTIDLREELKKKSATA
jgi:hypothetical protein